MKWTKTKRRWWLAGLAVAILVLASQLPWSMGQLTRFGLRMYRLDVQFASMHGHWLTTLEVRGLDAELESVDLIADTLRVRPALLSLVRGRLHMRELALAGAHLRLKSTESRQPESTPPAPMIPRLDRVVVRQSRLTLADSVGYVSSIRLEGRLGAEGNVHLDTLSTVIQWEGGVNPVTVTGRVRYVDRIFHMDTLSIAGSESRIVAGGHLGIDRGGDFRLVAAPLKLRELAPWVPDSEAIALLEAHVAGTDRVMQLSVTGDFSDGGQLALGMTLSPYLSRWGLDSLRVANVNPAFFASGVDGHISGRLSGELTGTSADSLSGELRLEGLQGLLNGVSLEGLQASAAVDTGHATLDIGGHLASAELSVLGEIALPDMSGQLNGEFTGFDIGQYLAGQSSALNGSFNVNVEESLSAGLTLSPGQAGFRAITGGQFAVQIDPTRFELTGRVETDVGMVKIESSRLDSALACRMELVELDLAGLASLGHASRMNARFDLQGVWPPDSLVLELAADSSIWNELAIAAGGAHIVANGPDVAATFLLETSAGRMQGTANLNSAMQPASWNVPRIVVADVNLQAFGSAMPTSLAGSLNLSGTGLDNAVGAVALEGSMLGDQVIDSARVDVSFGSDRALGLGYVYWPNGHLEFAGMADSLYGGPALSLQETRFENLNLGAVMAAPAWQTSLTGAVDTAYWHVGPVVQGGAAIRMESSSVNELALLGGTMNVEVTGNGLAGRMHFDLVDGHVGLDTLQRMSDGSFAASGTVHALDMRALADFDANISGSIDLAGSGSELDSLTVDHLELRVMDSEFVGIAVEEGLVAGGMHRDRLVLDTLDIRSSLVDVQAAGRIAPQDGKGEELALFGLIQDLGPLERWIGPASGGGAPEGTFRVRVTSNADTLRLIADVGLGPASLGDIRILDTRAAATGQIVNREFFLHDASVDVSRISVPALAARTAGLTINRSEDRLMYDANLRIDDRRYASVQGFANLPEQRVVLQDLDMRLDNDHWRLEQDAVISTGDRYRIRNLLLVEDEQEVAVDGVVDFDGQQNLGISLYNVQLGRFADLLGFEGLGGTLDGNFFLSGPSDNPSLDGSMALDVHDHYTGIGDLRGNVAYEDYRLGVDLDLTHRDGSTMKVSGHVPADLRLAKPAPMPDVDLSLSIEADELNLQWLAPFMDPSAITGLSGSFSADLDAEGTIEGPRLTGTMGLSDLGMTLPEAGISIAEGRLQTNSHGDTTRIEELSARSHQGLLTGRGHVALEDLRTVKLNLSGALSDFRLADSRPYQADADGDIQLTGTLTRPELTGRLDMTGAVIRPQEAPSELKSGPVAFTEADVLMLEQFFNIRVTERDTTTYSWLDAMTMDLEVGIPGNVWLRSRQNPEMDIALAGSLRLTKAAYEDQQLFGTLSVVPQLSAVHQFGRRFDIRSGRVSFTGPALDPYFDLEAAMAVREHSAQDAQVTILLEADGRLQDTNSMELKLRSEPIDLDPADILLYIATGRPAANALQAAGPSTLQAGSSLAISQLNALIAGAASAGLGLDVVRIQQEGGSGLTVTAGKHISRRLFTSVSWPLAKETLSDASRLGSRRSLSVEYVLYPWLLARLTGDTSALGLSILSQYSW